MRKYPKHIYGWWLRIRLKQTAITLLAFVGTSLIHAQQQSSDWRPNVGEDNKAASQKDTMDFVTQVLATQSRIQSLAQNPNKFIDLVVLRADSSESCTLRYIEREIDTIKSGSARASFPVHEYTLQLGTIDPLSISVKTLEPTNAKVVVSGFDVMLSGRSEHSIGTVAGALYSPQYASEKTWFAELDQADFPCPQRVPKFYRSCSNQPVSDLTSVTIPFTDQEYAHRFARALMHAALLCGGTKAVSPF